MIPGRGREDGEFHRHEKPHVAWSESTKMKIGQDQMWKAVGKIVGLVFVLRGSILSRRLYD